MSRPVFVCVPGASHSHHIYEPLRAALAYHGYTAYPLPLPSVGGNPPTYDFTEDVQAIRHCCAELADSGHEIILVMHAYGGLPGGEALWGLGRTERAQRGLRGGVIRLVFIMSWLAAEGFQGSPRGDVTGMFPYMRCDLRRGITTIDPRQAPAVFYNDMPRADAEYWTSQLLPQSIGVFWSQTTYASWRYIPTTYVLCGQDQCVTLPYAEMMLQTATESRPNMIDTVETCEDGGHSIMLSRVEWTTNMLRRAAGERV